MPVPNVMLSPMQATRIFARIGHPVLSLRRIRVGSLTIRKLRIGQYRRLKAKELYELKGMAKKK